MKALLTHLEEQVKELVPDIVVGLASYWQCDDLRDINNDLRPSSRESLLTDWLNCLIGIENRGRYQKRVQKRDLGVGIHSKSMRASPRAKASTEIYSDISGCSDSKGARADMTTDHVVRKLARVGEKKKDKRDRNACREGRVLKGFFHPISTVIAEEFRCVAATPATFPVQPAYSHPTPGIYHVRFREADNSLATWKKSGSTFATYPPTRCVATLEGPVLGFRGDERAEPEFLSVKTGVARLE
ncbi:hypothetical protein EVAR_969_1 [Eumeta japonica]|uniref:Uncharacterized protein n=1 Tax=Eumeta variegata TaxID=151549 RepID=A0A4C1SH24_EUMVA|nr:hypothetical protein EVAR_969_1 [Eumeta japonica]